MSGATAESVAVNVPDHVALMGPNRVSVHVPDQSAIGLAVAFAQRLADSGALRVAFRVPFNVAVGRELRRQPTLGTRDGQELRRRRMSAVHQDRRRLLPRP